MGVARSGHFWQLGSIASLATETTGREIHFGPNIASEAISECLIFKNFSWGSMPPDPPSLFALKRTQWPYQSKIAVSSPDVAYVIE